MKRKFTNFSFGRLAGLRVGLLAFFISFSTSLLAQERVVSGKVLDEEGFGLPGATILEKGSQSGTTTDLDGNYRLNVGENSILIFSFVGYTSQEISVGSQTMIDVRMELDVQALNEVVVVGYGAVEKGDVTGVISKVDESKFNRGVMTSPDQLLVGKVAGVSIISNSGEPGGQVTVKIRGGTSIRNSNEPLYVVDGVPIDNTPFNPGGFSTGRNPLNFINPSDVENIQVLKDASAAAIYGSRGANGVIIITTKSGSKGDKPKVTYDGNYGVSSFVDEVDVLTADEFRQVVHVYGSRNEDQLGEASTDWLNEILQTATTTTHNLSLSGGLENGGYRLSLGYQKVEGVLLFSETERTSLNYSMNKSLLEDALQFKFNSKSSITDDVFSSNQVGSALSFDPTQPIYDTASIYGGYREYNNPLAVRNPVAEITERKEVGNSFRNLSSVELRYSLPFLKGFSLVSNLSFDIQSGERRAFAPTYLRSENANNEHPGIYRSERYSRKSLLSEYYGEYKTTIPSINLDINAIAGYSYQNFINAYTYFSADSLTSNIYGVDYAAYDANSTVIANNNSLENRLISFYGRSIFSLDDKYVFTATLRQDGSTRFGKENRWGLFPSFALAWRISNEGFMDPLKSVLTYMKVRASYGVNGNQQFGDYQYLTRYRYSNVRAQYQLGNKYYSTLRPQPSDPALQWEETASLNLGIEFELFGGKLAGNIEAYRKHTDGLLNTVAPPVGTYTSDQITTNIGEIDNQGFEFELNSPIISKKDFRWDVGFNASFNKQEIAALDFSGSKNAQIENTTSNIAGDVGQTIKVWKVGSPVNSFYYFEQIYGDGGQPVYDIINRTNMYKDQNGDGVINENDLVAKNSSDPTAILGLTSNVTYKAFDLAFTMRSNLGNYVYNNVASNYGHFQRLNGDIPYNVHVSVLETRYGTSQLKSSYYIENASFLKLDNITLGYTMNKLKWMTARAYVTGQNLFTLTGYSGLNPELNNGIDNNLYPRSMTVIGGVNLTF